MRNIAKIAVIARIAKIENLVQGLDGVSAEC